MAGIPPRVVLIIAAFVFIAFFGYALTMTIKYMATGDTYLDPLLPGIPKIEAFENDGKVVKVAYYRMEGCPHCVAFQPEWEKFKKAAAAAATGAEGSKIQTVEYEARTDREAVVAAGVEGFPTVLITKPGGTATTYEGPRTAEALMAEVKK
jgi:thiol-disulfide isomerase/thioredoxin